MTKDEFKAIVDILGEENITVPKQFSYKLRTYLHNDELRTCLQNNYYKSDTTKKKESNVENKLFALFVDDSINVRKARQELGHYLKEKGMILRKVINNPYILDKKTNGYNSVDIDEIVIKLNKDIFFNQDLVHSTDVENALGFISERKKPQYNIVKFNNCLYDMTNFKVISANDEPVFTLIEVAHNYNPQAKGKMVKNFLETSLPKLNDNPKPEEIKKLVQGFLEMIGYLLTSGNKLNAFFILSGIGGAGKGLSSHLIEEIFGSDKVGRLQLQELKPDNRFATAHLENKQVNIVSDSPKEPIEDTGMLKSITGYDDIPVEPKGKDKYAIPKEEVPDMIVVCNNFPKFKDGIEESVVQRAVTFEFRNKYRGTEKENTNLLEEILENPEEMEWLIYNGIEAYKKMITEGRDFTARIDSEKARKLLGKHTNPISYILPILVEFSDETITDTETIVASELNELIMYVAEDEGLAIDHIDTKGKINARHLASEIRAEFNLNNSWTTKLAKIEGYDNSVTIYPKLRKTEEYDGWLEKMNKNKPKK